MLDLLYCQIQQHHTCATSHTCTQRIKSNLPEWYPFTASICHQTIIAISSLALWLLCTVLQLNMTSLCLQSNWYQARMAAEAIQYQDPNKNITWNPYNNPWPRLLAILAKCTAMATAVAIRGEKVLQYCCSDIFQISIAITINAMFNHSMFPISWQRIIHVLWEVN